MFVAGRSRVDITHSFVKADMDSILDMAGLKVKPDDILCGIRGITKEDVSSGMEGELVRAFARETNPDVATKGSEIVEILLVFSTT